MVRKNPNNIDINFGQSQEGSKCHFLGAGLKYLVSARPTELEIITRFDPQDPHICFEFSRFYVALALKIRSVIESTDSSRGRRAHL